MQKNCFAKFKKTANKPEIDNMIKPLTSIHHIANISYDKAL